MEISVSRKSRRAEIIQIVNTDGSLSFLVFIFGTQRSLMLGIFIGRPIRGFMLSCTFSNSISGLRNYL